MSVRLSTSLAGHGSDPTHFGIGTFTQLSEELSSSSLSILIDVNADAVLAVVKEGAGARLG